MLLKLTVLMFVKLFNYFHNPVVQISVDLVFKDHLVPILYKLFLEELSVVILVILQTFSLKHSDLELAIKKQEFKVLII